jgi:hypothetical protein
MKIMLNSQEIKKIEDFVYSKPRSVQEIAKYLEKNWRTVDRYITQIQEERATIATRTFREGTRGALKIVYWASMEKTSNSVFQEKLEKQIFSAKRKEDFSAFDIYQYVPDKNKRAILERSISEETTNLQELVNLIRQTKEEFISFSGNLSYINLKKGSVDLFKEIEDMIKRGVRIKVLCRVDFAGKENIEKLLSLNFKYGKELIEIRHHDHPIRALILDKKILRIKEINEPTGRINELDKKLFIFYTIKDKEWAEWAHRVFHKLFNNSITAQKRLEEINKIFK